MPYYEVETVQRIQRTRTYRVVAESESAARMLVEAGQCGVLSHPEADVPQGAELVKTVSQPPGVPAYYRVEAELFEGDDDIVVPIWQGTISAIAYDYESAYTQALAHVKDTVIVYQMLANPLIRIGAVSKTELAAAA